MSELPPGNRGGLVYGLVAYGLWGVVPLYFKALIEATDNQIAPEQILAHRVVWSVAFLALLLTFSRRWPMVATCFRTPSLRWMLLCSAVLVAFNWFVYIYSVKTNQVVQGSLGYFINPLVNVAMGMVFFRERMRSLQWVAIALALVGVAGMTYAVGELPWLALSLAGSFSVYGLLRKKTPVDGLVGLSVETFVLVPLAAGYLLVLTANGELTLGTYGLACDALILVSGLVTALPLICFGQAVRRLPLSTLGFLQYLAPSLQFLCAVLVFHERLKEFELESFICIWCGLAVFSVDTVLVMRSQQPDFRSL